jgi:hypothetical protein
MRERQVYPFYASSTTNKDLRAKPMNGSQSRIGMDVADLLSTQIPS